MSSYLINNKKNYELERKVKIKLTSKLIEKP